MEFPHVQQSNHVMMEQLRHPGGSHDQVVDSNVTMVS